MKPKISVIITTFKRPRRLARALNSVLQQTFKDFELIIINDDPSDTKSERVVSAYKDPRIVYIKNKKNEGSAKSLNIGLRYAQGEYIAILDDDDKWNSDQKLTEQIIFLKNHPDHVLVGTNIIVRDAESGDEIIRSQYPLSDQNIRKTLLMANPFAHSSVMYKKEIALACGGYDETLPRGKDYDLWLKLIKKGSVAILPGYFLIYSESSTSTPPPTHRIQKIRRCPVHTQGTPATSPQLPTLLFPLYKTMGAVSYF